MKKLLITSMAAVAIGLYAKADVTEYPYNTTESFENYKSVENYEGPLFERQTGPTENPEAYVVTAGWVTTATSEDGIFTVTNITSYIGSDTPPTVNRPIDATPNTKVLAIDTSNPLMRTVHTTKDSTNFLENAVFFDSVVQFTATEAKPTPSNDDKLMVWLYKSEDLSDGSTGAFGESISTNALVVTALNNEGEMEHFLTDMVIEPDSWHRLTIKSFKDSDHNVLFNIWVDATKVGGDFVSLRNPYDVDRNLKGVAFDGKGAVDDLVFTTKDPFAVDSYKITVKIDDEDEESSGAYKQYSVDGGVTYVDLNEDKVYTDDGDVLEIPQTVTKVMFKIAIPNDAKKLDGVDESAGEYGEGYYWIKEVTVADIISNGEGEVVLKVVDNTITPEVTTYAVTVNSANATVVGLAEKYAADAAVTFTVTANPGYDVVSVMMNETTLSVNAEGKYSFTMPAEAVTITVTTKAATPTVEPGKQIECDSQEAANEVAKNVTITVTDKDAADAGQAAFIKAVVKQNGNKWVVTAEINTEATGYIPADDTLVKVAQKLTEIANATEDEDGNVTVALSEVTPGLYYSVDVSENLAGENQGFNPGTRTLATSTGQVTLKVSKPKGNSAFFKVVQHLTKQ